MDMSQKQTEHTTRAAVLDADSASHASYALSGEPHTRNAAGSISCGCCVSEEAEHEHGEEKRPLVRIIISAVLFAAGMAVRSVFDGAAGGAAAYMPLACFAASFIIAGYDVILHAAKNITRGVIFDEHFLMTIASIGAFAIGETPEAAAVMLFYQIGEAFQDYAVERSRRSIAALSALRPDHAVVLRNGKAETVKPETVRAGEIIRVSAGERAPLDGVVTSGRSFVDTSALTGEPVPREVSAGTEVLAGSICTDGVLELRVLREYTESAVARIVELTEQSAQRKTVTERFITRFARVYTPAVTIASLLLAVLPPLIIGGGWYAWIERALTFLVVSCPCALVISVPLGFFGGIGAVSRRGVLIKGSATLEALARTDTAVFDKTGTLTEGSFAVTSVHPARGGGLSAAQLAALAAHAEKYSGHPVSVSLRSYHHDECCGLVRVEQYREVSGKGISAVVDGRHVLAGTARFLESEGIGGIDRACAERDGGTVIHVASDGVYAGHISISDVIKENARKAIPLLRTCGVRSIVMLTGDNKIAAERVGKDLQLDAVYAELLPQDKVQIIEDLLAQTAQAKRRGTVIFTGDGINDAPVLARADAGIAMGALGSDAAIEAADAVVMNDEPSRIADAIMLARRTVRVVMANIVFALGVKAAVLVLGALGAVSLWAAVFADVGVTVLAVLNSLRLLYVKAVPQA